MAFDWKLTSDELPKEGTYVLGLRDGDNWHDSDDQDGVNYVVVKLVLGLSKKDREKLSDNHPLKGTFRFGDEDGNNLRPYRWDTFGPGDFFGQEISHWCYIERVK